jgi:hypothetical protein
MHQHAVQLTLSCIIILLIISFTDNTKINVAVFLGLDMETSRNWTLYPENTNRVVKT